MTNLNIFISGGMWHRALRLQCLGQSQLLNSILFPECTLKIYTRSAVHVPHPALVRVPATHNVSEKKMQRVIKRVESPENNRIRLEVYPPPSMMESQSNLLPGVEKIRTCGIVENPEKLIDCLDKDVDTVCDALLVGHRKTLSGDCLGIRKPLKTGDYSWISYNDVIKRKNYIGSGLINLGLDPSQKTMIGICTKTRPEFVLTMMACSQYSMICVPLYNCFGMDAIAQIISQVDMEAVICETPELAANIIKHGDRYPKLKHIILMDDDDLNELSKIDSEYNIISLKELEVDGQLNPQNPNKAKPDDLFCICYTSGTTGEPKGVMLTHRNVLSCIGSLDAVLTGSIGKENSILCYLPCAHIYEIVNEIFCLYHGGKLGFYSGTTDDLLDDIQKLKPTVIPLVPKLMNLIYAAVRKQVFPFPVKKRLFHLALHQKQKQLSRGIVSKTTLWDKIFFSKIQERLGGQAQLIFSSSAPVCKEVMQFFRCAMGCLVFEVYGLSEVAASTMTLMSEAETGFVGAPLPCNHVKLVSIPEMSYNSEDNVGEICVRGSNVFKGYYKNPGATKEVLDDDGWFHTGDIGKWLPNGTLSIIDRKKHIFKMSQGEYIIPEKTEGVYMQSPFVSQVYVDGDPNQDFTVGIVVPDKNIFMQWAKRKEFKEIDFEVLCRDEDVRRAVLIHLLKLGKKKQLNSLHQIGNVYLTPEAFSQDNGLLTPTLKLKRAIARKTFENIFDKLYEEGNQRKKYNL